jgi:hypothetical protein
MPQDSIPGFMPGRACGRTSAPQAYLNGAREFDIMRQTGHRSLDTLRKYIRGRGLFRDNAAAKLGYSHSQPGSTKSRAQARSSSEA